MAAARRDPAQRFAGDEGHLADKLAIQAATTGGGHPVPQLDTLARTLAPRLAFVALLAELWAQSVQINGGWVGR